MKPAARTRLGAALVASVSSLALAACGVSGSSGSDSASGGSGAIPKPDVSCEVPKANLDSSKVDTSKPTGTIKFATQGLKADFGDFFNPLIAKFQAAHPGTKIQWDDAPTADDFDARMVSEIRDLLARFDWEHDDRQLALEAVERIVADDDEAEDDHWREAYTCSTCGALIGVFIGHGDAWRHYRGEGTAASPVELYDAGHEAAFGLGGTQEGETSAS